MKCGDPRARAKLKPLLRHADAQRGVYPDHWRPLAQPNHLRLSRLLLRSVYLATAMEGFTMPTLIVQRLYERGRHSLFLIVTHSI
jgi:hypothetical protein